MLTNQEQEVKVKPNKTILNITILVLMILAVPVITSEDLTLPWYQVEDWEVAACMQDFGAYETEGGQYDAGEGIEIELFSQDIIATMQVQKVASFEETNQTVINIGWYVQPLADSVSFEVVAVYKFDIGQLIPPEVIESGSATRASGFYGYKTVIQEEGKELDYFTLKVAEGPLELRVPVE